MAECRKVGDAPDKTQVREGLDTPMSVRKTLCRLDDIPDGGATAVDAEFDDGVSCVILLRQGSSVLAYHNVCPHTGGRLDWAPGRFLLEPGQIICAAHGACFFIESGRCFSGPARGNSLARVPVEVVDGEVRLSRKAEPVPSGL